MMPPPVLLGQLACLSAAALWALAVIFFRRSITQHGAPAINLVKCLLASLLLAFTVLWTDTWQQLLVIPGRDLALLGVSGLIGMTLGDTALFAAVSRIGVHRSLLLQTLAPVFAALLAALTTGEQLGASDLAGGCLVLCGVGLVVAPQPDASSPGRQRSLAGLGTGAVLAGTCYAVLAAFGQGAGVVVAKAGMSEMPALVASLLRLTTATVGLVVVVLVSGRLHRVLAVARDRAGLRRLLPATLLGTYLAVLLMMAGIALAPAAIAAVLLATSPVFSLIFESILARRWPGLTGVLGTLLAVAGVAVLSAA